MRLALAFVAFVLAGGCQPGSSTMALANFQQVIIDQDGPAEPWGKSVGDINGDGLADIVVGGHGAGGLVWYENPTWTKHVIAADGIFSTDHEVGDIDRDGTNDVLSLMDDRIVWFRNNGSGWDLNEIARERLHDVELGDLDGDGRPDVVARGQSAFGEGGGTVYLYYQRNSGEWQRRVIAVSPGEGLKLFDIDTNGRPDVVVNGIWLENPGDPQREWTSHMFSRSWKWPHTFIAMGDINGDGRPDIAMSPAELAGSRYRISWFEAPRDRTIEWEEHVIDSDVEAVHHFIGVADFDVDGRMDIATAMMHQGSPPTEVTILLNQNVGRTWSKHVLSKQGSHSMRILDFDSDGDADLVGANWDGEDQRPKLWVNGVCSPDAGCPCWRRHEIDSARPGRAVFIDAADLDGDGMLDIATGAWWYRNPGGAGGAWERRSFDGLDLDLALLADFDRDGDVDALATQPREGDAGSSFVFGGNDGRGHFNLRKDLPGSSGDFLQGVALARFGEKDNMQVALSWHAAGRGIELLTLPKHPGEEAWHIERVADVSQDEALSAGDIDRDGRIDLLLGTRWLRNEGESRWTAHVLDPERNNPDRNRLADINGDGRLDAIVGFEAISVAGDVVWYEQSVNPKLSWKRHVIGSLIGPMSLDVSDLDGDSDLDVVVGEHNLKNPQLARLVFFENVNGQGQVWREHVLHTGDEHHDGTLAADVDGDGDVDLASIGWGHGKVLIYENLNRTCK